mmetsp:Transcript_99146/g.318102  ORF Transcript_99146/g.318102 Transcript_99146/m.318102 type:complete len:301 (-) Transcript_99146:2254-3156(-)
MRAGWPGPPARPSLSPATPVLPVPSRIPRWPRPLPPHRCDFWKSPTRPPTQRCDPTTLPPSHWWPARHPVSPSPIPPASSSRHPRRLVATPPLTRVPSSLRPPPPAAWPPPRWTLPMRHWPATPAPRADLPATSPPPRPGGPARAVPRAWHSPLPCSLRQQRSLLSVPPTRQSSPRANPSLLSLHPAQPRIAQTSCRVPPRRPAFLPRRPPRRPRRPTWPPRRPPAPRPAPGSSPQQLPRRRLGPVRKPPPMQPPSRSARFPARSTLRVAPPSTKVLLSTLLRARCAVRAGPEVPSPLQN